MVEEYEPREHKIRFAGILCIATVMLILSASAASAGILRASVVKVDITPSKPQLLASWPRQSIGVHDHIYFRIVVLDDGQTQFYLIGSDLCVFSPSTYDEVAGRLEHETGIKPIQVWWTYTHTHSAPEVGSLSLPSAIRPSNPPSPYQQDPNAEYSAWVERKLIDGVKQAREELEPARFGVGWGMAMANINRRARDEEGQAFLGMNPDGVVDRRIGLIRLERANGQVLALIANYAMHGTVLGRENLLVSGDAPGTVEEYVEKKLGAPMLYINGAAGNAAPIYSVPNAYPVVYLHGAAGNPASVPNAYPDFIEDSGLVKHYFPGEHLKQFEVLLGDKILEANRTMGPTTPQLKLTLGEEFVETPRKAGMGWPSDLGKYIRQTSTGSAVIRVPIRFLKINNDIAIWAAPLELFSEIGIAVRDRSPFPFTLYFGYCNGWLGYMPTEAEFAYGGYEPSASPYTDQAERDLTQAVVSHLQGMSR